MGSQHPSRKQTQDGNQGEEGLGFSPCSSAASRGSICRMRQLLPLLLSRSSGAKREVQGQLSFPVRLVRLIPAPSIMSWLIYKWDIHKSRRHFIDVFNYFKQINNLFSGKGRFFIYQWNSHKNRKIAKHIHMPGHLKCHRIYKTKQIYKGKNNCQLIWRYYSLWTHSDLKHTYKFLTQS